MFDNDAAERLDGPIHLWFNLTYANYLTLPRSLMQSMSVEWQEKMVALLEEMREAYPDQEWPPSYRVSAIDYNGRFIRDPVPHYNRGRTFVPPKEVKNGE